MEREFTIYEQPLSELIRLGLRLENLFEKLDVALSNRPEQQPQQIMILIVEILNVLDRPDLKSKFGKEFYRLIDILSRLHASPGISYETLNKTLTQLKELMLYFVNVPGKMAQSLRNIELLATIRQNFLKLGGCSTFDSPAYFYWLQQPWEIQQKHITDWLKAFTEIRAATNLLLSITRQSSEPRILTAPKGFYHESLSTHPPCQLIRVNLPTESPLYPEISAGKHGISIRFMVHEVSNRPRQIDKKVDFQLTTCVI